MRKSERFSERRFALSDGGRANVVIRHHDSVGHLDVGGRRIVAPQKLLSRRDAVALAGNGNEL